MRVVNAVTTSWPALRLDRPTFSAVAESELDAVHRYLLFLTGNRSVAEDLTGETFEKAWRARHTYRRDLGAFTTWLYRIATNACLNEVRRPEGCSLTYVGAFEYTP